MSATSQATALIVGVAGTLTVGGAILFGAMADGISGPGPRAGVGVPRTVIQTDAGRGRFADESRPLLLAQAEEVQLPAAVDQADAPEKPDATQDPVNAEEQTGDAPVPANEAANPAEERMVAKVDEPGEASEESSEGQARLVASFRHLSAKDQKVYAALDKEITLEFPDNSLQEVVDLVKSTSGIPVRIDMQALTDAGLDAETRVQFTGTHSLGDALSMLFENVNGTALDSYVEYGVLHITTADQMEGIKRLRFYDLNNAVGDDSGIENLAQAVEQLVDSIDGGWKMSQVISLGDSLAIRAPLSFHKQIDELIAGALKLADARRAAGRPLPVVPTPLGGTPGSATQHGTQSAGSGFFSVPPRHTAN